MDDVHQEGEAGGAIRTVSEMGSKIHVCSRAGRAGQGPEAAVVGACRLAVEAEAMARDDSSVHWCWGQGPGARSLILA